MMDRTDYQILNLLQDDSRCTLRRMGDLVGLTPPAVSERIRRMEESGVIRGYHIDIDRTKLDCNITGFISVALEPDKYDKFCDFCASQSAIIATITWWVVQRAAPLRRARHAAARPASLPHQEVRRLAHLDRAQDALRQQGDPAAVTQHSLCTKQGGFGRLRIRKHAP